MRIWRRLALVAFLGMMGPAPSHAAPIFRLDDPSPTIVRPESGTATYEFTGTVTTDPGYRIGMFSTSALYDSYRNLIPVEHSFFDALITQALDGGTYSGPLFRVLISSDAAIGRYDQTAFGFEMPLVRVSEFAIATIGGPSVDASQIYAVNVVPESSSWAIAVAAVAGFWLRRRTILPR